MDYDFNGVRWGVVFLQSDGKLSIEDRVDLLMQATEMYLQEESLRTVGAEDRYDGILYTEGKWASLEGYYGKRFDAEVETNQGKGHAKFIVKELTQRSSTYGFSRN